MRYIPNSQADRQGMLADIGIDSIEQLFSGIPSKLRLRRLLDLPRALSEPELLEYFRQRAAQISEIGIDSIEQLFSGIPSKLRLRRLLDLPRALSEPELLEYFRQRAAQNPVD